MPSSAGASRNSRFAMPRRCRLPTTTSFTAKRSEAWPSIAGYTPPSRRSPGSTRRATAALAGGIAAGLDGVERKLTLPPAVTVDPHTLDESERAKIGADRLPTSLKAAIQNLKQDDTLLKAMGERLAISYIAVKELDVDAFANADEAFEFRQHIYKY